MTDKTTNMETAPAEEDALLAELIRSGGRRETPPQEHYEQVFAAAENALRRKREQVSSRRRGRYALAASILVAALGTSIWFMPGSAPVSIEPVRIAGTAEWRQGPAERWQALTPASRVSSVGAELRTLTDTGLSVAVSDTSIRIAGNSVLVFNDAENIFLAQGKIYIDTGRESGSSVTVTTPAAVAKDIGTQFEVRFVDLSYRLRVRTGMVQLAAESQHLSGAAGDELQIDADGLVERSEIASDDPEWRWAEDLAPAPGIDGKPLTTLLDWVEHETGREVVFSNPIVELESKQTIMHGSVENLAPLDALDIVLATTDFMATQTEEGKILISTLSQTD